MNERKTDQWLRGRKSERGQSIVEFSLVIVFLFLLFVSLIQMILLMYSYNTLADAAKEGVRFAIVHGSGNTNCNGPGNNPGGTACNHTATDVVSAVTNFAALSFQNIPTSEVTVDYNPNSANGTNSCNAPGCIVKVTVQHTYTPLFGLGWPSVTLNAAASGRIMN